MSAAWDATSREVSAACDATLRKVRVAKRTARSGPLAATKRSTGNRRRPARRSVRHRQLPKRPGLSPRIAATTAAVTPTAVSGAWRVLGVGRLELRENYERLQAQRRQHASEPRSVPPTPWVGWSVLNPVDRRRVGRGVELARGDDRNKRHLPALRRRRRGPRNSPAPPRRASHPRQVQQNAAMSQT